MLEWHPATEYPEQHVWVLAFRAKPPTALSYVPYSVLYREDNKWINTAGYVIDNITQWAYINPPVADHPLDTKE
jgi:hypothetical protein